MSEPLRPERTLESYEQAVRREARYLMSQRFRRLSTLGASIAIPLQSKARERAASLMSGQRGHRFIELVIADPALRTEAEHLQTSGVDVESDAGKARVTEAARRGVEAVTAAIEGMMPYSVDDKTIERLGAAGVGART